MCVVDGAGRIYGPSRIWLLVSASAKQEQSQAKLLVVCAGWGTGRFLPMCHWLISPRNEFAAWEFLFQRLSPKGRGRAKDGVSRWHYMGSELIHMLWRKHVRGCQKTFPQLDIKDSELNSCCSVQKKWAYSRAVQWGKEKQILEEVT